MTNPSHKHYNLHDSQNIDQLFARKTCPILRAEFKYVMECFTSAIQHDRNKADMSVIIRSFSADCNRVRIIDQRQIVASLSELCYGIKIDNMIQFMVCCEVDNENWQQVKHAMVQYIDWKMFLFLTNMTSRVLGKVTDSNQIYESILSEFKDILEHTPKFNVNQRTGSNSMRRMSALDRMYDSVFNRRVLTSLDPNCTVQRNISRLINSCNKLFGIPLTDKASVILPKAESERVYKAVMQCWAEISDGLSESVKRKKTLSQSIAKYSVIAAIVATSPDWPEAQVLSLGTGNKCISKKWLLKHYGQGDTVLDFHAEVVAKRAFQAYLFDVLIDLGENKISLDNLKWQIIEPISIEKGLKCRKKPNVMLHLYVSTAPCGDARTPAVNFHENNDKRPALLRVKCECKSQISPLPEGYKFTIDGLKKDEQTTVFNACSDKIAKWNVVGLQGSLLSHFLEPIYLDSVVLSSNYSEEDFKRAIYDRVDKSLLENKLQLQLGPHSPYRLNRPKIGYHPGPIALQHTDERSKESFSPNKKTKTSHNWYLKTSNYFSEEKGENNENADSNCLEIVNYRKDDIKMYEKHQSSGSLKSRKPPDTIGRLSKRAMQSRFKKLSALHNLPVNQLDESIDPEFRGYYRGLKRNAIGYHKAQCALKETLTESGQGSWSHAPLQVDLFPVEDNSTFKQVQANQHIGR